MSGDVLRRNAFRSLIEGLVVTRLFFSRQFALRMPVEVSAIASQCEHEQELGIETWRWNLRGSQTPDCGVEGFAKRHKAISPQRHREHMGTGRTPVSSV